MAPSCKHCHKTESQAKPGCGESDDGKHEFVDTDDTDPGETTEVKLCTFCGKRENEAKPACGESNDGKHKFDFLEVVSAETAAKHPFPCSACPDAWLYDEKKRPHMRMKGTKSKTCRNSLCANHADYARALEVKPKVDKADDAASVTSASAPMRKRRHSSGEVPTDVKSKKWLKEMITNYIAEEADLVKDLEKVQEAKRRCEAILRNIEQRDACEAEEAVE